MSDAQAWYRQPETFIAVAALVVSISAVVVGIYEASLQRAHDRAEVWPHLELETFITPEDASLYLENTGIGPAVVQSVDVAVDGRRRRNWEEVVRALVGRPAQPSATETVVNHACAPASGYPSSRSTRRSFRCRSGRRSRGWASRCAIARCSANGGSSPPRTWARTTRGAM